MDKLWQVDLLQVWHGVMWRSSRRQCNWEAFRKSYVSFQDALVYACNANLSVDILVQLLLYRDSISREDASIPLSAPTLAAMQIHQSDQNLQTSLVLNNAVAVLVEFELLASPVGFL